MIFRFHLLPVLFFSFNGKVLPDLLCQPARRDGHCHARPPGCILKQSPRQQRHLHPCIVADTAVFILSGF